MSVLSDSSTFHSHLL